MGEDIQKTAEREVLEETGIKTGKGEIWGIPYLNIFSDLVPRISEVKITYDNSLNFCF